MFQVGWMLVHFVSDTVNILSYPTEVIALGNTNLVKPCHWIEHEMYVFYPCLNYTITATHKNTISQKCPVALLTTSVVCCLLTLQTP